MLGLDYIYHTVVDLQDPRTEDIFLAQNVWYPAAITAWYVWWIKYMPSIMEKRKAYSLERIMTIYNIVQVIWCVAMCCMSVIILRSGMNMTCEVIDYTVNDKTKFLMFYAKNYYWMKFFDLADTVFIVLRKKPLSSLHVYHHGGMVLSSYIGLKYVCGGQSVWIGILNCFVHAVMYFYYLLCSYNKGYKASIWWKKHITQLQMLQFLLFLERFGQAFFRKECNYPRPIALVIMILTIGMLMLFGDFYYKAYIAKPDKQSAGKKK